MEEGQEIGAGSACLTQPVWRKYPCPDGIEDDCGYPACAHAELCARRVQESSAPPCSPPLDCPHEELVTYIRSMKGGERVQEMGLSGMHGMKGTVEIRDGSVCIRWDHREYADGAGVMVTSFTGSARIIEANSSISSDDAVSSNAHRE